MQPASVDPALLNIYYDSVMGTKVPHTPFRALGPELIPVYRQSAHR